MENNTRALFNEFLESLEADPNVIEYKEARDAYFGDRALSIKMSEYNVQNSVIEQEEAKDEPDAEFLTSVKKRVEELFAEISEHELVHRMNAAEEKLGLIFSEIDAGLQSIINPFSGCDTGSCAGCTGC